MLGFYLALIDEPSDMEKFTEIYNTYNNMMFKVAMSILHNEALAEEAVQDSFLKIAKSISSFIEPVSGKTASFIVIIVRNTSIDNLRKERNNKTVSYDDIPNDTGNTDMPDIEMILSKSGMGEIMDIISGMDKIYKDALKLKYLYGYNNSEIAAILNISPKNAEMRIYRGKNILKKKLEDKGYAVK